MINLMSLVHRLKFSVEKRTTHTQKKKKKTKKIITSTSYQCQIKKNQSYILWVFTDDNNYFSPIKHMHPILPTFGNILKNTVPSLTHFRVKVHFFLSNLLGWITYSILFRQASFDFTTLRISLVSSCVVIEHYVHEVTVLTTSCMFCFSMDDPFFSYYR